MAVPEVTTTLYGRQIGHARTIEGIEMVILDGEQYEELTYQGWRQNLWLTLFKELEIASLAIRASG